MQNLTMPSTYRSRFNPLLNYRRLFFLEGLGLQAAELNELQDMIRYDLAAMATYLIGQGTIVTGGTVIGLNGTALNMDAAGVNVDGHIVQVPSTTITILGTGIEYAGVAVINNLITSTQDPTITEQYSMSPNVGQPGSDREQYAGRWCTAAQLLTNESFFPIITLNNGNIISTATATTNNTELNQLINQYDNSVRGSALLNGMNVAYNSTDTTSGGIVLSISSGSARVLGVPVTIPYQSFTACQPIVDTQEILGDSSGYVYVTPPTSGFTVTPTTTGGSLAASTSYTYKITSVTANAESYASTAQTITTAGSTSTNKIVLGWSAIAGATSYNIYGRLAGDSWKLIANTITNSYTDTGAVSVASVTITAPSNFVINANYLSVSSVVEIEGYIQATVTVTKGVTGGSNNGIDVLPNPTGYALPLSIHSIVSVVQGGTTYSPTTDYQLTGAFSLLWRAGGACPATSTTYTVIYQYNAVISPSTGVTLIDVTSNNFSIPSANTFVNNSNLVITYNYYLNRIDRINIDQFGNFVIFKGTPGYFLNNIVPIQVSPSYLTLALVTLQYNQVPIVVQDTITNLKVSQVDYLQNQVLNLQEQVASLALSISSSAIQPTSLKRGLFVDSFINTNNEDPGQTNTCIIIPDTSSGVSSNSLTIPSVLNNLGNPSSVTTLPIVETLYHSQNFRTGSRQFNPYSTVYDNIYNPHVFTQNHVYTNALYYWYSPNNLYSTLTFPAYTTGFAPGEFIKFTVGTTGYLNTTWGNTVYDVTYAFTTSGSTSASLTLPAGTAIGRYLITATGLTSGVTAYSIINLTRQYFYGYNQGYTSAVIDNDYYNGWNSYQPPGSTIIFGFDPIGYRFQFKDAFDFTSIHLHIDEIPNADVIVRIVELTDGYPDTNKIHATARIDQSSLTLGLNRFVFDTPFTNIPNTQFAFTILTQTYTGKFSTAVVGRHDVVSGYVVAVKPFSDGRLHLAQQQTPISWLEVVDEDIYFDLYKSGYTINTPTTVALISTSSVTNYTDWNLSGNVKIPSGTTCSFYLQDVSGNQYPIYPNVPLFTVPLSGVITLYSTLESADSSVSPSIPTSLQLSGGIATSPSTYTSLAIAVPNGSTTPATLTILFAGYNPLNNMISVNIQTATSVFSAATFVSATPIGGGWNNYTYTYTGLNVNSTRLQIQLSTSNPAYRPKVTNVQLVVV
jgi:hypothetical protein